MSGTAAMEDVPAAVVDELVAANHILGHEGVLDAYGHVSVRHPGDPERFLLSRARSPEYVEASDVLVFDLDGTMVGDGEAVSYIERFIHAAVYAMRPDVGAVCHNHSLSILPFSIATGARLQWTVNAARWFGAGVPVWDIADEFGTSTDLLVRSIDQGRSLARRLGAGRGLLMRGHGSVVAAPDLRAVVQSCLDMERGARAQVDLLALGPLVSPTDAERAEPADPPPNRPGDDREWELLCRRAGVRS